LPRQVLAHGHWTLGREKMSKSTGNAVNPFFALDRFGPDLMRFYLAHDGGIGGDADYDNEYIIARYKKALQSGLGNLASRILRGKGWDVRRAVETASLKKLHPKKDADSRQRAQVQALPRVVAEQMRRLDPGTAAELIMGTIYHV
jgi:methionyl-tRNA synthetase